MPISPELVEKLIGAAKGLTKETRRIKMNVRKDFSLMNAEAYLNKVLHEIGLPPDTSEPPAIAEGYQKNFETMLRASHHNDLALVSARHLDGRPAVLVCAVVGDRDKTVSPIPFAVMIDGNPYEMFQDPTKNHASDH